MAEVTIHDVEKAILRGGDLGELSLYNKDGTLLAVIPAASSFGTDDLLITAEVE